MQTLVKYKTFTCSNCALQYQGVQPYIHIVLGVVCIDCLDAEVHDSKWA